MQKIDYCYHTHTTRCSHAIGTDEEYVLEAIKAGLKVIGFSDHVFLPGLSQPNIRGNHSQLDEYVASIRALKEKYKDQIEILVGFEAEYLEEFIPYYQELLQSGKIDYLIQGQHIYLDNHEIRWYFVNKDDEEKIELYLTHLIKGMETGLFSYIAHPDFFASGMTHWSEFATNITKRLCEAAVKYDVPLEFNLGGFRYPYEKFYPGKNNLRYPSMDFWKIVSEYPVKVFIGPDAHRPNVVSDDKEIEFALNKVKELNLNLQTRINKKY